MIRLLMPGIVLLLSASAVRSMPAGEELPLLVTSNWLAEHLGDPDLVVLHVASTRREYARGHIPGAQFLWTQSLSPSSPDFTLVAPSPEQADSTLRQLGVSDSSKVVLCFGGGNVSPTTRAFMTLELIGLRGRVALLDGGLEAWKAGGRAVKAGVPVPPARGTFRSRFRRDIVVDGEWVAGHLNDSAIRIVDARGTQFYEGKGGGNPRPGHIPGSVNIPFSSLVDSTNRLLTPDSLRQVFITAGITAGSTVVPYCHVGQQATLVYFVARCLGFPARLYDGSFEEWSGREELPVVNPAETSGKKP
jgi:thiosulfate/3-mercaptopyruvate sulfurtransferase